MATPENTPVQPPPGAPPSSGPFELSGGILCLDFANTWGDRARPESDQLRGFDDLLAFLAQAGVLADERRQQLVAWSARESAAAAAVLDVARTLRESLYRIFTARARGGEIPLHDLARLNATLGEALAHLRVVAHPATSVAESMVVPTAPHFDWAFEASPNPISPLWPIARSAAELLVSPELARVTQCDGARCTWLFLDQSRTRTRRWCSMESCGNRAKAQRHYRRQKA